MNYRRATTPLATLLLVAVVGLAACEAEDAAPDRTAPSAPTTGDGAVPTDTTRAPTPDGAVAGSDAATRGALPTLFSIMVELQGDMTRVSRGLWLESYDSVAAGARGIAEHPEIPAGEAQQIAEVLGDDMARFAELDGRVHDLSLRLAEEAQAQDLDAVLETDAAIRQACVECHTEFRDRLREGIGSP